MPVPTAVLASACQGLAPVLSECRKAWATWRAASRNAHCAAVMGSVITPFVRQTEWDESFSLSQARDYQDQLLRVSELDVDVADALDAAVQGHIAWLTSQLESGVVERLNLVSSGTIGSLDDHAALDEALEEAERAAKSRVRVLKEHIKTIENELKSLEESESAGMSASRRAVIAMHETQIAYITARAADLRFSDDASVAVTEKVSALKGQYQGNASAFFNSKKYKKLQAERKAIESERNHVELGLQSYFDHASHGASKSESAKPERYSLTLAPKLTEGKAGYKQVQIMDMFCISRANEMWAIIPHLIRVGHDIDPIECVHWRPPVLDHEIPEPILPYRKDQNTHTPTPIA